MECAHFDAGRCRSCTLLPVPFGTRVANLQAEVADLLGPFFAAAPPAAPSTAASRTAAPAPAGVWLAPVTGPESGFRNKAKMVVAGTVEAPTLGILDAAGAGIDLRDCPLYPPAVHAVLAALPALIRRAQIPPYDITRRRGELKHVIVTVNEDDELMVRFVLRSTGALPRLREHLGLLTAAVPGIRVLSANIHPDHSAVLEGAEEIALSAQQHLPMRQGRVRLQVLPRSFVQTNTAVAGQLYTQVADWVDAIEAAARPAAGGVEGEGLRVWDLYCGVGGFALHAAQPAGQTADQPAGQAAGRSQARRMVTGVEISAEAIASARAAAAEAGLAADFIVADAAAWAAAQEPPHAGGRPADVLIVNPPRRGIGPLADWIEDSGIEHVIYSSCNPRSLAGDLQRMPSLRITAARLLDMFPHTAHAEVVVRLERTR